MKEAQYTRRQAEYLAFIERYMTLMGVAPAENDIAEFFNVAGASAHQMIVRLEEMGALTRIPGRARSIRKGIFPRDLPVIGWPPSPFRLLSKGSVNPIYATAEVGDFLARRMLDSHPVTIVKMGALIRISAGTQNELRRLGADELFIDLVADYFARLLRTLIDEKAEDRTEPSPEPESASAGAPKSIEELRAQEIRAQQQRKAERRKKKPRGEDSGQRVLFD